MEINSIKSFGTSFKGKYELNANQDMPTANACLKRDSAIGYWVHYSKDNDIIAEKLKNFYTGPYNEDNKKECNIILDIPNKYDIDFENTMFSVGQKFNKIG